MYNNVSSPPSSSSLAAPRSYDSYDRLRLATSPSLPNLRRDTHNTPDARSMLSSPSSLTLANGHSPAALQNHIYTAFLERKTADVALHVHGTWNAIYRLHRVVLIQAVSRSSSRIPHTFLSRWPLSLSVLRFEWQLQPSIDRRDGSQ